jgi:hypothetical protein
MSSDIFINEKVWNNFTDEQTEEYVEAVFQYYRKNGFPYYPTDLEYRQKEFKKLQSYDIDKVLEDGVIRQTMHGLALAWSYQPHAYNVQVGGKKTPLEAFEDDEVFYKIIRKRLRTGTYMSDSGMRKMLKMFSGVQGVSNFRPTAAAAIYKHFAPNGRVWDMSMGYGGRMLGAITAGIDRYYGNDPCEQTFEGLNQMSKDFSGDTHVIMSMLGSELGHPQIEEESLDLCFTSPPYFGLEQYSDEETQSYIKYPTKEEWVNGFLGDTFAHCYRYLKSDNHMVINIADTKQFQGLEKEAVRIACKTGFDFKGAWRLALSKPMSKSKHTGGFKYEPLFIFKKP